MSAVSSVGPFSPDWADEQGHDTNETKGKAQQRTEVMALGLFPHLRNEVSAFAATGAQSQLQLTQVFEILSPVQAQGAAMF